MHDHGICGDMGTDRTPDICSEPTDYLQRPIAASKGWRQTNWVSQELLKAKSETKVKARPAQQQQK